MTKNHCRENGKSVLNTTWTCMFIEPSLAPSKRRKRVAKGFYRTRDCPKISHVMRDCAQLIHVMCDKIVQCDAWFVILEARDAWFTY